MFVRRVFDDISEKEHSPRQRTVDFWFVFFFSVLPVWSVIPVSWAFVAYAFYTGRVWDAAWPWRTLLAFAGSEVCPSPTIEYSKPPLNTLFRFCSACTTSACRTTSQVPLR